MEWAGQKRGLYVASVLLAVVSVIAKVCPYVFIGSVVNALIAGDRRAGLYVGDLVAIAALFVASEACHTASTSLSHVATFEVIRNIRSELMEKLARVPLGRVLE